MFSIIFFMAPFRFCTETVYTFWPRQQIARTAENIIGVSLSICICKATSTVDNPSLYFDRIFTLLTSGRRCQNIYTVPSLPGTKTAPQGSATSQLTTAPRHPLGLIKSFLAPTIVLPSLHILYALCNTAMGHVLCCHETHFYLLLQYPFLLSCTVSLHSPMHGLTCVFIVHCSSCLKMACNWTSCSPVFCAPVLCVAHNAWSFMNKHHFFPIV